MCKNVPATLKTSRQNLAHRIMLPFLTKFNETQTQNVGTE